MIKKDTVIGAKFDVMLWGFKCTLQDRRSGELADGYIVVNGNEEYDLEAAHREIKERYGKLGYTVKECEYDDTRLFNFDAIEIFARSRGSRCAACDNYIREDSSVGQQADCQIIINMQEEGHNQSGEVDEELISAFNNSGYNCKYYEMLYGSKKPVEDKPDYLAEIMATLAELDDTESEVKEN